MSSSLNELTWSSRCEASLRRSRQRREAAQHLRRRRIRTRGSGASLAAAALAVAMIGGGAAVAHQSASGVTVSALLSLGDQGPGVAAVQRALGLSADGVFGASTDAAVRSFQRRNGLLVDGIVGPQTRAALGLGGAVSQPQETPQSSSPAPQSSTPAPQQSSTTAQPSSPVPSSSGAVTQRSSVAGAVPGSLAAIAQCESGGNPSAIGGGGQYRGKYQFTYATWRALGGSGDPAAASEAEQDRRASILYRQSGASSWPSCG